MLLGKVSKLTCSSCGKHLVSITAENRVKKKINGEDSNGIWFDIIL
jgi:hypothetical protein